MPISGMQQGSGKSRFAGRVFACACVVACAAAAAPAALAEPAVDEYTLTLPQASGDQHITSVPGAESSVAGAASTAAPTQATDLDGSEQDKGLTQKVGTDASLGAPATESITPLALNTTDRGVPEIVADTLTDSEGGAPFLLAALGAIAAAGVWLAFRRRRSNLRADG
jgi:hypothetical protein